MPAIKKYKLLESDYNSAIFDDSSSSSNDDNINASLSKRTLLFITFKFILLLTLFFSFSLVLLLIIIIVCKKLNFDIHQPCKKSLENTNYANLSPCRSMNNYLNKNLPKLLKCESSKSFSFEERDTVKPDPQTTAIFSEIRISSSMSKVNETKNSKNSFILLQKRHNQKNFLIKPDSQFLCDHENSLCNVSQETPNMYCSQNKAQNSDDLDERLYTKKNLKFSHESLSDFDKQPSDPILKPFLKYVNTNEKLSTAREPNLYSSSQFNNKSKRCFQKRSKKSRIQMVKGTLNPYDLENTEISSSVNNSTVGSSVPSPTDWLPNYQEELPFRTTSEPLFHYDSKPDIKFYYYSCSCLSYMVS